MPPVYATLADLVTRYGEAEVATLAPGPDEETYTSSDGAQIRRPDTAHHQGDAGVDKVQSVTGGAVVRQARSR